MDTTETTTMPVEVEAPADDFHVIWRHSGKALLVMDFVLIVASALFALYVRAWLQPVLAKHFSSRLRVQVVGWQDLGSYLNGALLLAALWVLLIWRDGGYESGLRGMTSPIVRLRSVLLAGAKAFAALMVLSYLYHGHLLSRPVYLMTATFGFGSLILARMLFRALDRDLAAQGLALQKVLVAGLDDQSLDFANRLVKERSTLRLIGLAAANGEPVGDTFADHSVIGHLDDIQAIYERAPFDKLVLSQSVVAGDRNREHVTNLIEILNFCEANDISLYTLPNVFSIAVAQNEVGTFSGIPLIKLRDAARHQGYAIVKRFMDLVVATLLLTLGAWLWLGIAILIRLTSRGPVIFTQMRVGLHGRLFKMYKFRSMVADAEARLKELVNIDKLDVPGFKLKGDPRVTSIGRILRRTSLDEIPQLLNVIKGEMSLVGPRPEMQVLVDKYDPWQRRRLKAKPGITGYQQVMARGLPLASGSQYDLVYLKHQSLLLDCYILLKTVIVVLRGSGVTH